uniref:myb-binding protein 1A-like n=1 Tax=Callithrix jacchus TaxID=9483 RepID=UPI0023DD57BA|nr:myb-binding protein 1A-like [Callithrix jacchus]
MDHPQTGEPCGQPAPRDGGGLDGGGGQKPTSQIPETRQQLSLPLECQAQETVSSTFFRYQRSHSCQDALHRHTLRHFSPWSPGLSRQSPTESCDLLGDIQTYIRNSLGERCHRSRTKAIDPQELPWVEVLVEILLALLAQPSHLMCQVAQSMFDHVCSHLTPRALQLILDVLNSETSEDEDDHVVVMDKSDEQQLKVAEEKHEDGEESRGSESEDESDVGDKMWTRASGYS